MANMIKKLSSTMGLHDLSLVEKALEYMRILQMKGNIGQINESFKAAICLDLAAVHMGIGFDRDVAKTFSNTNMSKYRNMFNAIEKVLGLDRCITISELCVQLGCTSVNQTAEKILSKYKECDRIGKEFDHPQYIAAAVYTACQLKRIKVDRAQFLNISRLKTKQWKDLTTEFILFAEKNGMKTEPNMKQKSKKGNDLVEMLEEYSKDELIAETKNHTKETSTNTVETYENWKKRILEEAYLKISENK